MVYGGGLRGNRDGLNPDADAFESGKMSAYEGGGSSGLAGWGYRHGYTFGAGPKAAAGTRGKGTSALWNVEPICND